VRPTTGHRNEGSGAPPSSSAAFAPGLGTSPNAEGAATHRLIATLDAFSDAELAAATLAPGVQLAAHFDHRNSEVVPAPVHSFVGVSEQKADYIHGIHHPLTEGRLAATVYHAPVCRMTRQ
jgi:hypothetical protein